MDMDTIGAALKRKLGPLPVWIWAILGGVIVYWLRTKGYFGGGLQQGETLQPRQEAAGSPQPQTVLQPGESVYDPNTGSLTTAPGNDTGTVGDTSPAASGGGAGDYAQAVQDLSDAITSALTDREQPDSVSPTAHKKPSALSRAKAAVTRGKVGPKNTQRLKAAGYTASQIAYHAKRRTPLGKPAHKPNSHQNTTSHSDRSTKPRSSANVKHANGGRESGHKQPSGRVGKSRVPNATAHSTTRQRPKVPLTRRAAPVHHPVSSHSAKPQAQAQKQQPAAHRPSSPPTRPAPRAPAPKPPAPKKPKKRK